MFIRFSNNRKTAIIAFLTVHFVRYKLQLDDALQVLVIHLFSGVYSDIAEGIVAHNVYGTPDTIHSGLKWSHIWMFNYWRICNMRLFNQNYDMALDEALNNIIPGKKMSLQFHRSATVEVLVMISTAYFSSIITTW
eukprot:204242_1